MNKKITRIALVLGVLFITTLACKQSGEIVPDAEATQRAIPTATPVREIGEASNAKFTKGAEVVFIGKGYLIPLYANPGDTVVISHAARNDAATIIEIVLYEEEIWYEVKSVAGDGWLLEEFLEAKE